MRTHLYNLQLNIDYTHLHFYKKFLHFLRWSVIHETKEVIGYRSEQNGDIWLVETSRRDMAGFNQKEANHILIKVDRKDDIDQLATFLKNLGSDIYFGEPRLKPELATKAGDIYYQLMFKTKDNILFEVVYRGPADSL